MPHLRLDPAQCQCADAASQSRGQSAGGFDVQSHHRYASIRQRRFHPGRWGRAAHYSVRRDAVVWDSRFTAIRLRLNRGAIHGRGGRQRPRRLRFRSEHKPRSRVALNETDRALSKLRAPAPDFRCARVCLVLDWGIFARALPTLLPQEPAVPVDSVIPAAGLLAHRLTCVAIGDAGPGRRTGGTFCTIGNAHFLLAVARHRRGLHRFGAQQNESNDDGNRADRFVWHRCSCPF
jgi:hypothetical protein